jgi:serine protease Do
MAIYAFIPCHALAAFARSRVPFVPACLLWFFLTSVAGAADLYNTIARIKPSVVGIGTFQQTRSPSTVLNGTGFAVGDGRHVVTNAHVLRELNASQKEELVVLVPGSSEPEAREAVVVAKDRGRDIAVLRIGGAPLPALTIGDSTRAQEGMSLAFTGFPIGMALGLYPATHRATLAALVPIARAGVTARQLNPRLVTRLRDSAYVVFQLDATAYPGNSGSPLYDPASAEVYGIINSVFIQGTREQVITRPSGITYAIPSIHIRDVLEQAGVLGNP